MSILITENKQIVDTETGELLNRFEHRRRNFVWFNYNINELTDKGFNKADIFRIFYLATFIDYSNMLRCDNHKWTKDDIKKELRLPDKTFYRFFNKLIQNEILFENPNGNYRVNDKYFYKGNVRKGWSPRVYCDKLQQIYRNAKTADHTRLGCGFAIMPCVNLKYNIVCNNPLEFELDKIEPLRITDILDELKTKNLSSGDFLKGQDIIKEYYGGFYINPEVLLMGFDY